MAILKDFKAEAAIVLILVSGALLAGCTLVTVDPTVTPPPTPVHAKGSPPVLVTFPPTPPHALGTPPIIVTQLAGALAQLSVAPSGTSFVQCKGMPINYPNIAVINAGGQLLSWQAAVNNTNVTLAPSTGSLSGGQAQVITITQASGVSGTDVRITSNGGNATVTFACI